MATTDVAQRVVCDAGPLIHLDELACLDLLTDFPQVIISNAVIHETARFRQIQLNNPSFTIVSDPEIDDLFAAIARNYTLHIGELTALILARQVHGSLLLTDDGAARLACLQMSINAHGTLGMLVRAIRRKQRTPEQVIALIQSIPTQTTLHIRSELLDKAIAEINASVSAMS